MWKWESSYPISGEWTALDVLDRQLGRNAGRILVASGSAGIQYQGEAELCLFACMYCVSTTVSEYLSTNSGEESILWELFQIKALLQVGPVGVGYHVRGLTRFGLFWYRTLKPLADVRISQLHFLYNEHVIIAHSPAEFIVVQHATIIWDLTKNFALLKYCTCEGRSTSWTKWGLKVSTEVPFQFYRHSIGSHEIASLWPSLYRPLSKICTAVPYLSEEASDYYLTFSHFASLLGYRGSIRNERRA